MGKIRIIRGKYFELSLNQQEALKFYETIYKKSCFHLKRKFDKFSLIQTNYKFWSKEEDDILWNNIHLTCKLCQKLLPNRTLGSIQARKNKLRKEAKNNE